MNQPGWLDADQYPYDSRFTTLADHQLHYLDEGTGPPILFLHGNPTWSFLYRHLIRDFRESFRCIAIDWPGFGLSEKQPSTEYSPSFYADVLIQSLEALGVSKFHLITHDWGGPIGLDMASQSPDRVRKLVVFNSWIGSVENIVPLKWFSQLMGGPVGTALTVPFNLFPALMGLGVVHRTRFFTETFRQYRSPFESGTRRAIRDLGRSLIGYSDWLNNVKNRAKNNLRNKPLYLIWGRRDPALPGELIGRWTSTFPDHRVERVENGSHFLPEDIGDRFNEDIKGFLRE